MRVANARATIDTPDDVFLLLAAEAAGLKESRLWRVDLDRDNRIIGRELIADRGADTIVIAPRRVFRGSRGAVAAGAAKDYSRPQPSKSKPRAHGQQAR